MEPDKKSTPTNINKYYFRIYRNKTTAQFGVVYKLVDCIKFTYKIRFHFDLPSPPQILIRSQSTACALVHQEKHVQALTN